MKLYSAYKNITLPEWSELFRDTYRRFIVDEHDLLFKTGSNHVTSGWSNVGLISGNLKDSPYWSSAIETIGGFAQITAEAYSDGTQGQDRRYVSTAASSWSKLYNGSINVLKAANTSGVVGKIFQLRACGAPPAGCVLIHATRRLPSLPASLPSDDIEQLKDALASAVEAKNFLLADSFQKRIEALEVIQF